MLDFSQRIGRLSPTKRALLALRLNSAAADAPSVTNDSSVKRLVAYLVLNHEQPPTAGEIRGFLKKHLPGYMIPSTFVVLDALPLTSNGKIDRHALPEPDQLKLEPEEAFVAPRTAVEQELAVIWTDVLGIERVGIHDNFFDLGGHSLLATQIISRVRNAFRLDLPLHTIFDEPTIDGLARSIESTRLAAQALQSPPGSEMENREEIEL
jgi:acyl carrier protein